VLCIFPVLLASLTIYNLRLRQISERIRGRLEERFAERERIARELHDTLLQGFHGLLLRFQAAAERMPRGEAGRALIEQELDRAEEVLEEGRRRVQDLRTGHACVDLAELFTQAAQASQTGASQTGASQTGASQTGASQTGPTLSTRVVVQGTPRKLHPLVQQELASIGQEAIRNVIQHAHATKLEIGIDYHQRGLSVSFKDDGIGIDPDILARGSLEGHFGLPGMTERARRIQGKIEFLSSPGLGTGIQIDVPAGAAYAAATAPRPRWLLPLRHWEAP
jgi:signal transduction histidine kinase